jgi:hypothetical protein
MAKISSAESKSVAAYKPSVKRRAGTAVGAGGICAEFSIVVIVIDSAAPSYFLAINPGLPDGDSRVVSIPRAKSQ